MYPDGFRVALKLAREASNGLEIIEFEYVKYPMGANALGGSDGAIERLARVLSTTHRQPVHTGVRGYSVAHS
jgi:hypothetical protein